MIVCVTVVGVATFGAELRLCEVTAPPGVVVGVPVTCVGASGPVAAQFDVHFDSPAVSLAGIAPGEGLAGHVVDQQQLAVGQWRVLVYSPTNGPFAPGKVVWLNFSISTNAPDGIVPLVMTNAIVAQVVGRRVEPLQEFDGALTVRTTERIAKPTTFIFR